MLQCSKTATVERRRLRTQRIERAFLGNTPQSQELNAMSTASKKTTNPQDAMKPVEAAVQAGKETVESFMKVGTETASKQYEQAIALTKEQVEKASGSMFKNYNELTELNKANLDAVMASSNTFAKGFEAISKEFFSFAQANVEQSLAATKKLLAAKNAQDLMDMQSEFARGQFDKALAESAKLTEMGVQVANEAFEPLQGRVHVTVEKLMKPAA